MEHLIIAYKGSLILLVIFSLSFIYISRDNKKYLLPFFRFYLLFSIIFILDFIRTYILQNMSEGSILLLYISHGITNFLNYMSVYFGIITAHRLLSITRNLTEKYLALILIPITALSVSPLSVEFDRNIESMIVKSTSYFTGGFYTILLIYILFILIFFFKRVSSVGF